jgi:uncharacterized BrkB/YihY/UPF0761 family membrane protein
VSTLRRYASKCREEVRSVFLIGFPFFVVEVLALLACLWLATHFAYVKADFKSLAIISLSVATVSLIPLIGLVVGLLLFFYLLRRSTNANSKDVVWVVLFASLFSFMAKILLIIYLDSLDF